MNAKILLTTVSLGLLLGAGCAGKSTGDTYTYRGSMTGENIDMTLDNLLESNEDRSYQIELNAIRKREGAWDSVYYLEVRYAGASDAGYMDIGPGETLVMTVDGQPLRLRSAGSATSRRVTGEGHYLENAVYPTNPEELKRIARAKEVKVQVVGQAHSHYRTFKPENSEKFRKFVLMHMGGF
jgi:hypothetical protein